MLPADRPRLPPSLEAGCVVQDEETAVARACALLWPFRNRPKQGLLVARLSDPLTNMLLYEVMKLCPVLSERVSQPGLVVAEVYYYQHEVRWHMYRNEDLIPISPSFSDSSGWEPG